MVSEYISENYKAIKQMACTIAKKSLVDCEELCHIVILDVLESDQSKIEELIKKKQLRYWMARMMMNQYNSVTSPYYYTYRDPEKRHREAKNEILLWFDSNMDKKIKDEEKIDFINTALAEMTYFDRTVTEIYYDHNHSFQSMSDATGICKTTIFLTIKRARNEIKKQAKQRSWRHD